MRKLIFAFLILVVPSMAQATTNAARLKTWTAEKLYAADLNAEYDNIISYLNNNIASWTNVTATATEINQLHTPYRFTNAYTFTATTTDSANELMNTGFTYTNHGKAVLDSAEVDTLYSNSNGTRGDNTFFFNPLTDLNTWFGTPAKRVRSFTGDTSRVQVANIDTLTGTTISDTWTLKPKTDNTGRIGAGPALRLQSLWGDTVGATIIANRPNAVNGLNAADSVIITSGVLRVGTTAFYVASTSVGIGTAAPAAASTRIDEYVDFSSVDALMIRNTSQSNNIAVRITGNGGGTNPVFALNDSTGATVTRLVSGSGANGLSYLNNAGGGLEIGTNALITTEKFGILAADGGVASVMKFNATQANADGTVLDVRSTSGSEGGITLAAGGAITYGGYTLAHNAQFDKTDPTIEPGMIVSVSGTFMNDGLHPNIRRTNGRGDKAVYGILGTRVAAITPQHILDSLSIGSKPKDDLRLYSRNFSDADPSKDLWQVLAGGVRKILVTDTGGNIEVGDFLSPSTVSGYGERQTVGDLEISADNVVRWITVAKATESVDWNVEKIDPVSGIKRKLIHCTDK